MAEHQTYLSMIAVQFQCLCSVYTCNAPLLLLLLLLLLLHNYAFPLPKVF